MTDQMTPDVTDDDRRIARAWAEFIESNMTLANLEMRAAARVILDAAPAPPRPTLADMTPEERDACQWMQADVANRSVRYVITNPYDDDSDTGLVSAIGEIEWMSPERVTPRPDLPRMEWPGDKKPDPGPALPNGWRVADHKDNGRVIVTNTTPNRDGYVCYVLPADDYALGYDWLLCKPYELTYLDQGDDTDDTERNRNE